ncbi:MAG: membrane protein insertase YidC [Ktedonobacteraceae bacterium]|nr:membrane protein insertase YidC [Ktedonobacteraceae bacterium]MBV9710054.1 membrane protein insertase YidC [Ktedonobacteraceae bacterium]
MSLLIQLFTTIFAYPIVNVLLSLYHMIGDFGFAIIILTAIIFILTLPLMRRQTKVLKAQQALQPEIEAIKRKYPDDLVAQTAARRQLFKEHNIPLMPPFIPTLAQTLVLSGVFLALNTILRNATLSSLNRIMYPFLVHFAHMPDLSLTWFTFFNAAWHISLGLPDPTHILPLVTGIITFIQMRMAQPLNLTQTRETLQQGTQILQLLIPLLIVGITIFFAWQFAAGVALYRLAFLVMTTIRQYFNTGWGSLWTLPGFALNRHLAVYNESPRPASRATRSRRRRRHGGNGSSRRRNRNPKRGK